MNRRQLFRLMPVALLAPAALASPERETREFESFELNQTNLGRQSPGGPFNMPSYFGPTRFTVTITEPSGRKRRWIAER